MQAWPAGREPGSIIMNSIVLIVVGGAVIVAVMFVMGGFNGLVGLRNRYRNAFSQIDVQLKRRHDLIPNLVETAKGYLQHERQTLEAVVAARNAAVSAPEAAAVKPGTAPTLQTLVGAENNLAASPGEFLGLAATHPGLKTNHAMAPFMERPTSASKRAAFR